VLIFLYGWNHLYRFDVESSFLSAEPSKGSFTGVLTAFPLLCKLLQI
jgi:hypothetical protein